jgi:glutamyl endopeptidase
MPIIITRDNGDLVIPGPASGQPRTPGLQQLFVSGQHRGPKLMADGVTPQSVLGTEDRQRRTDTDQPPLRMVCSIEVASGETEVPQPIGTGWLVGPRTVITAGHVLRWQPDGREAIKVRVIPGRDGATMPFGAFEARHFHYHPNWRGLASDPRGHDIAAIRLPSRVGDTVSFFGVAALTDATLGGRVVNIPGYPAEVTGQQVARCTELWWHANHIKRLEAERLFYDVDTSGGQSGSPIMLWPDPTTSEAAPLVVGVHNRGDDGDDAGAHNAAVRINAATLGLIRDWIDADDRA